MQRKPQKSFQIIVTASAVVNRLVHKHNGGVSVEMKHEQA